MIILHLTKIFIVGVLYIIEEDKKKSLQFIIM